MELVEALALVHAIRYAHIQGLHSHHVTFKGDCLTIVQKVNKQHEDLSPTGHIVQLIKELLAVFPSFSFVYIPRSSNNFAHCFAQFGTNTRGSSEWYHPSLRVYCQLLWLAFD